MTFRRFPFYHMFQKATSRKINISRSTDEKADEEFDPWTLFVLNLNAQIRMTPILDLPYQLIMKLMNIFIFLNYTIEIYIHRF